MKKGIFTIGVLVVIGILFVSFLWREAENYQDTIYDMAKGREEAVITIGIWENGQIEYHLYGKDGEELPPMEHIYAIGSITKTFTGSLIAKQVSEGKINPDDGIDKYIEVPEGCPVPTIKSLMTHTSGLSEQWEDMLEKEADISFSRSDMIQILEEQSIETENGEVCYSNYGSALTAGRSCIIQYYCL